jgi:hypothetical protein
VALGSLKFLLLQMLKLLDQTVLIRYFLVQFALYYITTILIRRNMVHSVFSVTSCCLISTLFLVPNSTM